jgi:hypothetical protein
MIVSTYPAPLEGASRSSRQSGAGCHGRRGIARRARPRRTVKSCGPGAPTLASSLAKTFRRATVAKKPGTPGRSRISRYPIAQGMPECFGEPVVTNACAFYTARAATGAQNTRHSLRPPFFERVMIGKTRANHAAGMLTLTQNSSLRAQRPVRRSSTSEGGSNPDSFRESSLDCFVAPLLAMTTE